MKQPRDINWYPLVVGSKVEVIETSDEMSESYYPDHSDAKYSGPHGTITGLDENDYLIVHAPTVYGVATTPYWRLKPLFGESHKDEPRYPVRYVKPVKEVIADLKKL